MRGFAGPQHSDDDFAIQWDEWKRHSSKPEGSASVETIWHFSPAFPPQKILCKRATPTSSPPLQRASTEDEDAKDPFLDLTREVDRLLTGSASVHSLTMMASSPLANASLKCASKTQTWATLVDLNASVLMPSLPVRGFAFELDSFQKHAILNLEADNSVFIAAHTSAGKTVVAEYAIALCLKHLTKAVYTSPIKALSNQKFRDFSETFGKEQVGILTGDVQINVDHASCLIMTTEILRSILYKGSDLMSDVEVVIFDEVHYINDAERGVVWEEALLMLASHVKLVLLSATIPNTLEFADWIGRTRQKMIYVISTMKRPIPLEHFVCTPGPSASIKVAFHKIVDAERNFLPQNYKQAVQASSRAKGDLSWHALVHAFRSKELLPAVIFTFSRKKCEEYMTTLYHLDLTSAAEKNAIHLFLQTSLGVLKGSDRQLPQVLCLSEALVRGVCLHHSGILPIMKEVVELLFSKGFVKVLFATETFAIGINMPARTVVFSSLRKHDGVRFRDLLAGEYTQMSGRAGRRGKDSTGTVVIMMGDASWKDNELGLRNMILGTPTRLTSQFRLTYHMILQLLRVETFRVQDMMKRSFGQHQEQKQLPEQEELLKSCQEKLKKAQIDFDNCSCSDNIANFYHYVHRQYSLTGDLCREIHRHHQQYLPLIFCKGRVLMHRHVNNEPIILLSRQQDHWLGLWIDVKDRLHLLPAREDWDAVAQAADFAWYIGPVSFDTIGLITSIKIPISFDVASAGARELESLCLLALNMLASSPRSLVAEIPRPRSLEVEITIKEWHSIQSMLDAIRVTCSEARQHYVLYSEERELTMKVAELQLNLSGENLALLPEYQQRLAILKKLDYIDEGGVVLLKGQVACQMNTLDELVVTQLLFDNAFKEYCAEEMVALLSCFVFQEKIGADDEDVLATLSTRLATGVDGITRTAADLARLQLSAGLNDLVCYGSLDGLRTGLVEAVYEWARGMPFKQITDLTSVSEGSIVRTIMRLDEACRDVRNAANIMGDVALVKKMEQASKMIKRDICFAASLYI